MDVQYFLLPLVIHWMEIVLKIVIPNKLVSIKYQKTYDKNVCIKLWGFFFLF